MISALAARDRRALIVGVATISSLVLGVRAVPAWWRWRADARAEAAEAIAQQQQVDAVVSGLSRSLDSLEARGVRLKSMGPAFVTGATPAEAASNLAALVAEVARSSLVRIDAIEMRADSSHGPGLSRVRLEAQATGDISGLAALLRDLEKGPTLLAVRQLSVRPQAVDGPADQIEALAIRFSVEGLALVQTPTPQVAR